MKRSDIRTLVVDDSAVMRRALRVILEKNGLDVVGEAGDGMEAIKLFKELEPGLVTLDIIMPKMSGVETLRLLKKIDPQVRVLMVTAMSSQGRVQECARFGAAQYIIKPFEEEKIRAVLAAVLPGEGD